MSGRRSTVECNDRRYQDTSLTGGRAFLKRAVTHLVRDAGIRQFLDVGTGMPTAENTHQVARAAAPESRIVYVDNDHIKLGCAYMRGRWDGPRAAPPRALAPKA
jgi:hypothetical protein